MSATEKILNPFKILGLRADASQSEVKKAYQKLVARVHPDKGGNPAQFRLIQRAYQQINHDHFSDNSSRSSSIHYNPNEFPVPERLDSFQIDRFNRSFNQQRQQDHNIYQVDPTISVERQKHQYQHERSAIDQELGSMKPIMNPHGFNNERFNQAWKSNSAPASASTEISVYREPQAMGQVSLLYNGLDGQSNDHPTQIGFSNYGEILEVPDDPRYQNGGSVTQRYQEMMQHRSSMNLGSQVTEAPQGPANLGSQGPMNIGSQNHVNLGSQDFVNTGPQMNPHVQNYDLEPVESDDSYYQNQLVSHQNQLVPHQNQLIPQSNQVEAMQQVYMQAQIDLMQNLSHLLAEQRRMNIHVNPAQKNLFVNPIDPKTSQKPLPVDRSKMLTLEKKIREMKKTIAVQDKLLKSISKTT